ncbi:predicted protein [Botrytis cinerea T4]|uniref:Uncharacterized protein n=1 Tax=Botryotinia fuckeliana (strain T4) TaxID=999810 RepID=G2YKC9_BOTF4|nr:predicted protein [Botrytis cinerea T4]
MTRQQPYRCRTLSTDSGPNLWRRNNAIPVPAEDKPGFVAYLQNGSQNCHFGEREKV